MNLRFCCVMKSPMKSGYAQSRIRQSYKGVVMSVRGIDLGEIRQSEVIPEEVKDLVLEEVMLNQP